MHYKNIFSILSISICLNVGCLFGNYAFKKKVKSVCKSYRISVESSQLSLNGDEYSINMESGRNNFEMFMLVGFASAGQAIAHQKEMGLTNAYLPSSVNVSVAVPVSKGEYNTFIANCSSDMAISLADGSMDSSEFMQEIMKKIDIL
jgi:predicted membrane protein